MQCFYHAERPASGVCKNCGRGLCVACAADVAGSLGCRNRCEEAVRALNELQAGSIRSYEMSGDNTLRNAAMYVLFGLLFMVFGLLQEQNGLKGFLIAVGMIFLLGALFQYFTARRMAA